MRFLALMEPREVVMMVQSGVETIWDTGVLVCRLTALRETSLARICHTNLYGQREQIELLSASLAPLIDVT